MLIEEKAALQLLSRNETLAIAESCTGGLLGHRLTNVPGSSKFLTADLVCYSNDAKKALLKIPNQTLRSYGAVSEPVAELMAKRVRALFKAHYGIGITGIAGPSGGTKTKPVGLTFIAIATASETLCLKCHFPGDRAKIKKAATTTALNLLLEFMN
ncbi:MAG: CinA family protein [Candidatus Omnitrophota bacterium]|jgi:nicotinamide-nucleotide amidase